MSEQKLGRRWRAVLRRGAWILTIPQKKVKMKRDGERDSRISVNVQHGPKEGLKYP